MCVLLKYIISSTISLFLVSLLHKLLFIQLSLIAFLSYPLLLHCSDRIAMRSYGSSSVMLTSLALCNTSIEMTSFKQGMNVGM